MSVQARSRGPRVKRGNSRMSVGESVVSEVKVSTLIQIVTLLFALGLLSVVAATRYIDAKRNQQQEVEEAEAHGYLRALHGVLTKHTADHYLEGAEWVRNGEDLMGRLEEEGLAMPPGMRYAENRWIDERTGLTWEFQEAAGRLPPRIRRVEQRPSLEKWEMEPIQPETLPLP